MLTFAINLLGLVPSTTHAVCQPALAACGAAVCPHGNIRPALLVPAASSSRAGAARFSMMAGDDERERSAQSKMEMRLGADDDLDESELDECSLEDMHVENCLVRRRLFTHQHR